MKNYRCYFTPVVAETGKNGGVMLWSIYPETNMEVTSNF
jgi:hypothetical protein